jgi:hypothetical protein
MVAANIRVLESNVLMEDRGHRPSSNVHDDILDIDLPAIGLVLGVEIAQRTNLHFFRENTFVLGSPTVAVEWLERIGPGNRSNLTSVIIEVYTMMNDWSQYRNLSRLVDGSPALEKLVFRIGRGLDGLDRNRANKTVAACMRIVLRSQGRMDVQLLRGCT